MNTTCIGKSTFGALGSVLCREVYMVSFIGSVL